MNSAVVMAATDKLLDPGHVFSSESRDTVLGMRMNGISRCSHVRVISRKSSNSMLLGRMITNSTISLLMAAHTSEGPGIKRVRMHTCGEGRNWSCHTIGEFGPRSRLEGVKDFEGELRAGFWPN